MRATKKEIIKFLIDLKEELLKNGFSKIALFGSYARDDTNLYSDIDIAIQKDKNYLQKYTAYEYFEQVASIKDLVRKKFQKNSDIFDLDSNSSMKKNIEKDLIYV